MQANAMEAIQSMTAGGATRTVFVDAYAMGHVVLGEG